MQVVGSRLRVSCFILLSKCGLLDLKLQIVVYVLAFKYFGKALSLTLQVFFKAHLR